MLKSDKHFHVCSPEHGLYLFEFERRGDFNRDCINTSFLKKNFKKYVRGKRVSESLLNYKELCRLSFPRNQKNVTINIAVFVLYERHDAWVNQLGNFLSCRLNKKIRLPDSKAKLPNSAEIIEKTNKYFFNLTHYKAPRTILIKYTACDYYEETKLINKPRRFIICDGHHHKILAVVLKCWIDNSNLTENLLSIRRELHKYRMTLKEALKETVDKPFKGVYTEVIPDSGIQEFLKIYLVYKSLKFFNNFASDWMSREIRRLMKNRTPWNDFILQAYLDFIKELESKGKSFLCKNCNMIYRNKTDFFPYCSKRCKHLAVDKLSHLKRSPLKPKKKNSR